MAHIHRALIALLLLFSSSVYAYTDYYDFDPNNGGIAPQPSLSALVAAAAARYPPYGYTYDGSPPGAFCFRWDGYAAWSNCWNVTYKTRTITCEPGYTDTGSSCEPPQITCPAAGSSAGNGRVTLTAAQKQALSANGGYHYATVPEQDNCVTKLSLDLCTSGDDGVTWQCVGQETWTGDYYNGTSGDGGSGTAPTTTPHVDPPAGEENQPTSCPTGQCPGTVNGVSVCKPCNGVSVKAPTVEEKLNGGVGRGLVAKNGFCGLSVT